jgi:hypothetical protein
MEPAAAFGNDLEVRNASGRLVVVHSKTLTRLAGRVLVPHRSALGTLELIGQA